MVDVGRVKAAQPKVFDGVYGKRIEVVGDLVKQEVKDIAKLSGNGEYEVVYNDTSGKKSLARKRILQVLHVPNGLGTSRRPRLRPGHETRWRPAKGCLFPLRGGRSAG